MLALIHTVSGWLNHVGVLAVTVVLFIECFGIPSPDEIILLLSGYLVSQHRFSYPVVLLAAVAGSTLGGIGAYWLARLGGRPVMLKYFRFLFRTPERLDYWERYFQRHGDIIVLVGRIISGVRAVISYPAGLFEMPLARFVLYTVVGSAIWAVIAVTLGYILGPHVVSALESSKQYEAPIVGGLVVLGALWWWWERRRRRIRESPHS
ncbi:MAG: DedA family protein [Sulfobacillus sp.]|nr:DedA family protein [Sulfobacillus sp.]